MNLRAKTLAIVAVTLFGLLAALYVIGRLTLLPRFEEQDEQETRQSLDRAKTAIRQQVDRLATTVRDDGLWDEAYANVQHPSQKWADANFAPAFQVENFALVVYLNDHDQPVLAREYKSNPARVIPLRDDVLRALGGLGPRLRRLQAAQTVQGLVLLPDGPMLIAGGPVLTSSGQGPVAGSLIMGLRLDRDDVAVLGATTNLKLTVVPIAAAGLPPDVAHARDVLARGGDVLISPENEDAIAGFAALSDIDAKPQLLLRVESPRRNYHVGQATLTYLMVVTLGVGTIFGFVTIWLLERQVLSRLIHLSQSVREIGTSASPTARLTVDSGDEIASLAKSINDTLAARHALEEQLRQAQKMEAVGELAGGVAHDFNNLLTVIRGYSHLLLDDEQQSEDARMQLEQIKSASEKASALTQQLLAFSRKHVLQPEIISVNQAVMNLEKMLRRLIGEHIDLRTRLEPNVWLVKADSSQIEQILMNLAINARDAMPSGGTLTVATANAELDENYARGHAGVRPGQYAMVSVSDTGTGMTPEVRERIFEPFFTTKETGKGTGLGLAMVYGIVKQSGGTIWVTSEVGYGTTFKIYLPRTEEEERTAAKPPQQTASVRGTETILLVEDDRQVRELARSLLEANGYSVLVPEEPGSALVIGERNATKIRLLVTDVIMPGINGHELAQKLVAINPGIKVLYMSGYTGSAIVPRGVLSDDVNFLQKPFSPSALAEKVRAVLDRS